LAARTDWMLTIAADVGAYAQSAADDDQEEAI
jgi:hypothetical protein